MTKKYLEDHHETLFQLIILELSKFACEQCAFKTPSSTLLKGHTESAHEFACEQCDYKSTSRTTLRMHVERSHEFACEQ